jgi:hypothetical protein
MKSCQHVTRNHLHIPCQNRAIVKESCEKQWFSMQMNGISQNSSPKRAVNLTTPRDIFDAPRAGSADPAATGCLSEFLSVIPSSCGDG